MVILKTDEEIELLRQSNLLVSKVHGEIVKHIRPGITTLDLDKIAEEFIRDNNGVPGFLGYRNFPNTLCVSVNNAVVHGIPNDKELKDGDIVSVDCGVILNDFYGDCAYTYPVGEVEPEILKLMQVTKEALYKGIENAIIGKRIGDIGYAIQSHVEKFGYTVVREMVGHGVGRELHEDPEVPNHGKRGSGILLQKGLVIAIEPMINMGKQDIRVEKDGWTTKTRDGKPSAHFEHTLVVNKGKADILTTFSFVEEILNQK